MNRDGAKSHPPFLVSSSHVLNFFLMAMRAGRKPQLHWGDSAGADVWAPVLAASSASPARLGQVLRVPAPHPPVVQLCPTHISLLLRGPKEIQIHCTISYKICLSHLKSAQKLG